MCTAATFKTRDHYFGRTLDNDCSYGEEIAVTPRRFPLNFRNIGVINDHFAMIGTAHVSDGYPLYYEAVNERGLGMAGLNFVGNAKYKEYLPGVGKDNIAVYEFIQWVLAQCATVEEARALIGNINLVGVKFGDLPVAELHWMLADGNDCIVVESVESGIKVYDNTAGVMTNNPPFDIQSFALNNYIGLSTTTPRNTFCNKLKLDVYCRGMGGIGLPGDLSSRSRFVRAAFVRNNSKCGSSESESVAQFFHILGSVFQPRGCCVVENGKYEITVYSCCINATRGIYYYTTYDNPRIHAVDMHREDLDGKTLARYLPVLTEDIDFQN